MFRLTLSCCLALCTALALPAAPPLPLIETAAQARAAQGNYAARLNRPVQFTNSLGMTFQLIPPGRFVMGTPGDERAPLREVTITRAFYLGTTEVTRAQYRQVTGKEHSTYFPGEQQPINYITWYHAEGFVAALKKLDFEKAQVYRLPTEAEWEYAARAGTRVSAEGDQGNYRPEREAWLDANSEGTVHPVAQRQANAFGLYDMLGNVWEWCSDYYDPTYYTWGPTADPTGPKLSRNDYRVVRGGSALHDARAARPGNRAFYQSSRSERWLGFRIVLAIPDASEGSR
jgi:formylglycine-generating enzyme required for sulfatase activity